MSQRNIIIAVVVLLILAGVGYFFFTGSSDDVALQPAGSQPGATSTETSVNSDVVLSQLNQLQQISLDTDFLSSQQFQGLENFSISINEQPTGRNNPFIPALNQTPATITTQPLSASLSTSNDQDTAENQQTNQPSTPSNFPSQPASGTTSGAGQ